MYSYHTGVFLSYRGVFLSILVIQCIALRQVYSAFRIAKAVADAGKPVAILNVGATRADALATLKIEALAGEALPRALADGGLDRPWG